MEQKLIKAAFWGMALSFLVLPLVAMAAMEPVPSTALSLENVYTKFVELMKYVFIFAIVLAVIMMIWGGISYMTASGDDEKIKTAKKRIIWGVIGAAIVIGAWTLVTILARFLGIVPTTLITPS